ETNELVTIKADALLVFYGVSPVKGKVDQWQVEIRENAISVGPSMETSRKGVFAVGNSVFYDGKLRMIVTALGEAATAIGSITTLLYPERTKSYKH
ncbi:MAG TPA: ferredoxin--NADP(+) reductase, partial [Acholeplasmataceae bacterium]|nr:ferredoxin--NADP(+) reductase [Acholeplasmataceae bacterium]